MHLPTQAHVHMHADSLHAVYLLQLGQMSTEIVETFKSGPDLNFEAKVRDIDWAVRATMNILLAERYI